MQNFIQSKFLHGVLIGIAGLVAVLAIFALGMGVGAARASRFSRWCEANERQFSQPGPMGHMGVPAFPADAHGVFGDVLSTSGTSMTVEGQDGIEHEVLFTSSTRVRSGQVDATTTDIRSNAHVGVLGDPDDQGGIEARLIRIFP
jgi:hypothetical protein